MASRVTVYDKNGIFLAELHAVDTTRSWVLNDYGRCEFTMSTSDPKCTELLMRYGNFVLIEHIPSQTTDGNGNIITNGKLPDWVGVIVPPRMWGINAVKITAFSAEYVMFNRAMPDDAVTDTGGGIFYELLNDANESALLFNAMQILPGNIDMGGPTFTETLKISAHEHAQNVATNLGQNFDISGGVSQGVLSLYGNWYPMRGINTNFQLHDGDNANIEFVQDILIEQGQLCNDVIGFGSYVTQKAIGHGHGHRKGRAKSPRIRRSGEQIDQDSINKYGLFQSNQTFNVSGLGAIVEADKAYLDQHAEPTLTFKINALDNGLTFSQLDIGNVLLLQLTTVGFFGGSTLGFQDWVRIDGMQYVDSINKVELTKHVYRPPRNRSGIEIPIGGV